jgi:hypothetical protein
VRWHRYTALEVTVARELLIPGWHDAVQLANGAPPRKAKRIAERYVAKGYADRHDRKLGRTLYRASDGRHADRALRKISDTVLT